MRFGDVRARRLDLAWAGQVPSAHCPRTQFVQIAHGPQLLRLVFAHSLSRAPHSKHASSRRAKFTRWQDVAGPLGLKIDTAHGHMRR